MPADLAQRLRRQYELARPPPELSLSGWADEHYHLSVESAAEPGRWRTLPYQRGIMDAITDPRVERISFMKSARVGATKMMNATVGYYMHQDPCPILVVQPTVEDAEGYSKEEVATMLRDCPSLSGLVLDRKGKSAAQTILHKTFPGGLLSMVGANSGRGFRRVSRRVVVFDEVDGYPASAGNEGDPVALGMKRAEYYADRKIIAASTPLIAGHSRIEALFEEGDRRRYHVPCPHCDYRDILVFREGDRGHFMQWPKDRPEEAYFVCRENGCVIEHRDKQRMIAAGGWEAEGEFGGHASFHIWAAYSYAPNTTWAWIAREFLRSKSNPMELKTYVNTVLGETWQERGEAPDWEKLYHRRETYAIGSVPDAVILVTAGVDVQKDRFVFEVVGWGEDKQSWSIDSGVMPGDTSDESAWARLDSLLDTSYGGHPIAMIGLDTGYNTQVAYNWARTKAGRVLALKGSHTERRLIGTPKSADVAASGKNLRRGVKVWPVGVGVAKSELYGWLRLPPPEDDEPHPTGYCHFPEYDQEFFKQLTAEHLVTIAKRSGHTVLEWQVLPNRENHFLDCRVYARAAASVCGLDRHVPDSAKTRPSAPKSKPTPAPQPDPEAPSRPGPRRSGSWLERGRGGRRKGWLGGRR